MRGLLRTAVAEAVAIATRRGVSLEQLARELQLRATAHDPDSFLLEPCSKCGGIRARIRGQALRKMRKGAGLRLRQVGELAGFGPGYLSRIEREHRPASAKIQALYESAVAAAEKGEA
jgi:hypothetical protein